MTFLRVATWNLRTCRTREGDRFDLDLTAATLRSLDADLVALQEIDREQQRSGHIDQARALAEALATSWHFAPTLLGRAEQPSRWRRPEPGSDPGGPAYGIALLSRLELESVETVALPRPEGRGEPRVALVARVRAGGGRLTVAATHLSFLPRDGIRQLRRLQRHLAGTPAPRLLLGDLNLWLPVVRLVSLPGWRPPGTMRPSVQLDHVLAAAGSELHVRRTRIAAGPISDHRAAVVDLEVGEVGGPGGSAQAGRSNHA
jgi:endonuclease/exonuclease/phosphatase family metal-dependent hydrolase